MTSVFMTYAATLSVLRDEWGMSATAAGSISTGFQLGYAVSLVFFSSLADRVGARRVFLGSAWLSAVFALAWALWARSYLSGLVLYTLVALSQGGTYTTAIMLFADRYPPERRGAAVGWLIASSSAGYALSLLVSGSALAWGGYPLSFFASACGPVLGVVVLWQALRATPNVLHPRREGARFGTAVLRNRPAIRLILGYTFHSWELLGMWAWTPAFVAVVFAVGAVYGFTALGDSPVLSTALTEEVGAAHLGAALALRSFLGFGAGAIAPIVFGRILDLTNAPGPFPTTWGWAFVALGLGGLVAAYCAWGLAPDRGNALRAKTTAM